MVNTVWHRHNCCSILAFHRNCWFYFTVSLCQIDGWNLDPGYFCLTSYVFNKDITKFCLKFKGLNLVFFPYITSIHSHFAHSTFIWIEATTTFWIELEYDIHIFWSKDQFIQIWFLKNYYEAANIKFKTAVRYIILCDIIKCKCNFIDYIVFTYIYRYKKQNIQFI